MKSTSKALEVNLATTRVDVSIAPEYSVLQEILSQYYGIREAVTVFLKELSHPLRNWQFIVQQARTYALDYVHLLIDHERGAAGARCFVRIFSEAVQADVAPAVKSEAADDLLLFLNTLVRSAGDALPTFAGVLESAFDQMARTEDAHFAILVRSPYQINRLAAALQTRLPQQAHRFAALLRRYYAHTYRNWLDSGDPAAWLEAELGPEDDRERLEAIVAPVSHTAIRDAQARLEALATDPEASDAVALERLVDLPGYGDIVAAYRHIPQQLLAAAGDDGRGNQLKIIFLFHVMNVSGLASIHEEALRDINRTVTWLIGHENHAYIRSLIQKTFAILKARSGDYPTAALNCVLNMGKGVFQTDESELITDFIDAVIDLGFQLPMIAGVGNDWQFKVNSHHLLNVRIWIELTALKPRWSTRLLSYLTIHLALCGVFIKDTDLFPRHITALLNSDIEPVYNLVKQLARLLPVFFNDIGAEGRLRDISTQLDEITHREDPLVHFLRKQSHVESNNLIVRFMESTLQFWRSRDKRCLAPWLPPDIFARVSPKGPYVNGVHRAMAALEQSGARLPHDLLTLSVAEVDRRLAAVDGVSRMDRERIGLALEMYHLLYQKYHLEFVAIGTTLAQLRTAAFPELHRLQTALDEKDLKRRAAGLLDYLEFCKTLILSERSYEACEDIYHKRHFTIDIPSMYGSYHEMKFDALGLSLRLESLLNVLFEELIRGIDLTLITKATVFQIFKLLELFERALKLDGIRSLEMERQMEFLSHSLDVRGFSFTQYLDIFKGFARAVKNIVNDFYNNIHEENLARILVQVPADQLLPKFRAPEGMADGERFADRVSEIFFRDRIATSLGLQSLDRFLGRILKTLFQQAEDLSADRLQQLLNYDPKRAMTSLTQVNPLASGIIHLGNKGINMVRLGQFGFPVPPGFIVTTEVFRYREIIDNYPPARSNFEEQVAAQLAVLEHLTGKRFGDQRNPLLLSVRSGAAISQPGMMDTFLDVGLNETIAEGLAASSGNPWFAWDNYRRYLQCFGMSRGLERDDFDAIIAEHKRTFGIAYKRTFSGAQMRAVALAYKSRLQEAGIQVPNDPFRQLLAAIHTVLSSWHSAKARTYRRIMGISEDWGTAVTVQAMVYGNLSRESGSGVVFTHNPRWSGDSLRLWGDFTLGNQGEDVVSGLVNTLPVSTVQRETEGRRTEVALESHFPEIYKTLKTWASDLIYNRGWNPQEMEFTFEGPASGDLFILQTRDMAMRERKQVLAFDLAADSGRRLGHGVGVSGGAMAGRLVFDLEEIDHWRAREADTHLILARNDTVPDDIREIFAADGLLTARGGLTSHAAVVAHRLDKTCVVGCSNLVCNERERTCRFGRVVLRSGDYISLDGLQGTVFQGRLPIRSS